MGPRWICLSHAHRPFIPLQSPAPGARHGRYYGAVSAQTHPSVPPQRHPVPIRLVRVISRLNVGGPAIQVIALTRLLEQFGYGTTLVHGTEGPREGNMHHLLQKWEVEPVYVPALQRDIGFHDLRAVGALARLLRRRRPALVHTHAAKAGMVGRVAAVLALPRSRRPIVVHTFHGHVFEGVFNSRWRPWLFVRIERLLARLTTHFIAVSDEVRQDLVRYRIASKERISVVHLGFDLTDFQLPETEHEATRRQVRSELDIPLDARVVTIVARVVRMKRVDRFLRVAALVQDLDDVYFVVVGDGDERPSLEQSVDARSLRHRLRWTGMRHDIPRICAATDVMVLTSDNEGTPVALIEAQAAALPVVGTNVGGVSTVIRDGVTGFIRNADDETGLAAAIRLLASDPELARRLGDAGRKHVLATFGLERLVSELNSLYRHLLAGVSAPATARSTPGR